LVSENINQIKSMPAKMIPPPPTPVVQANTTKISTCFTKYRNH
jgi:hypothetical protein